MKLLMTKVVTVLLAVAILMAFLLQALQLYAHFTERDEVETFYVAGINASCVIAYAQGKPLLACVPGDRRKAVAP